MENCLEENKRKLILNNDPIQRIFAKTMQFSLLLSPQKHT